MKSLRLGGWVGLATVGFIAAVLAVPAAVLELTPAKELDQQVKLLEGEPPEYPKFLLEVNLTGSVTIQAIVNKEGRVIDPLVVESGKIHRDRIDPNG